MTAHMPGDAYGIVRRLVGPVGPELSCDECFDLLDVYVELEEGDDDDADAAMPAMRAHLLGCPACRDDHDSLRALLELAAVASLPASNGSAARSSLRPCHYTSAPAPRITV